MSYEIECEKRILLTKHEYFYILDDIKEQHKNISFTYLRNRYFDTPNLDIQKSGCMLRMRSELDGERTLTLKIKGDNGDIEYHQKVSSYMFRKLLIENRFPNGVIKEQLELKGIDTKHIRFFGILETRRLELKKKNHLFVLDINDYNGLTDYNLEVEAASIEIAEKEINNYCKKYSLTMKNDYLSKSSRFFKTLN